MKVNTNEQPDKNLANMSYREIDELFSASKRNAQALGTLRTLEATLKQPKSAHEIYFKVQCYLQGTYYTETVEVYNENTGIGIPTIIEGGVHKNEEKARILLQGPFENMVLEDMQMIDKLRYESVVKNLSENLTKYQVKWNKKVDDLNSTLESMPPLNERTNEEMRKFQKLDTILEEFKTIQEATETLAKTLIPDMSDPQPYRTCVEKYLIEHKGDAGKIIKEDQENNGEYNKVANAILSVCPEIVGKWLKESFSFFKSEEQKTHDAAYEKLQEPGFMRKP